MIDEKFIQSALHLSKNIILDGEVMAKKLTVTFLPYNDDTISPTLKLFVEKLKKAFLDLGVNIVPFDSSLKRVAYRKRIKLYVLGAKLNLINILSGRFELIKVRARSRLKKDISVIAVGELKEGSLPSDYVLSLRRNPMLIIQEDTPIQAKTFKEHMYKAINLFSWNLVNLAVVVRPNSWLIYSYNMSHPEYEINDNFKNDVLNGLIPKIFSPVMPPLLDEFVVQKNSFSTSDNKYKIYIEDLVKAGSLFDQADLFPQRRALNDLKFRNLYYKWLGERILDKRSGMSFGFLARQLPIEISKVREVRGNVSKESLYKADGVWKCIVKFNDKSYEINLPDIQFIMSKSGADKTSLDADNDIVMIGIQGGDMFFKTPNKADKKIDYKPSFDTRVILAHGLINAIYCSLILHIDKENAWANRIRKEGMGLAHWHGYINPKFKRKGWYQYGKNNLPVSCSSPQAAAYAAIGKNQILNNILSRSEYYEADVHIEPQHGINVSYFNLAELGKLIIDNPNFTSLGNKFYQ